MLIGEAVEQAGEGGELKVPYEGALCTYDIRDQEIRRRGYVPFGILIDHVMSDQWEVVRHGKQTWRHDMRDRLGPVFAPVKEAIDMLASRIEAIEARLDK